MPICKVVISLKKLIESNQQEWALEAVGSTAVSACPRLGTQLQVGLLHLLRQLSENATLSGVRETQERVESELIQCGDRSAEYYKGKPRSAKRSC